ncbi:hypothetical protein AB1K18_12450 [Peribacillus simplex]|uniref:hypothetical protein n=1 Tax=Peribacillus simplex TaxID=1478 RepID=UPI003B8D2961
MWLIVAKRRLAHGRGGASEERKSDGLASLKAFKGTKKALTTPVTSLSLRSSSAVARSSLRSERQLIDHFHLLTNDSYQRVAEVDFEISRESKRTNLIAHFRVR